MIQTIFSRWSLIGVGFLVGLLSWPAVSSAQQVMGQASAVQATLLGLTTALSDTGTLSGTADARQASQLAGSVSSLVSGGALHATTIGWSDQVVSEASLANLNMNVAGYGITADFIMSWAMSVLGGSGTGTTSIDGLRIGGVAVFPTGAPNEKISFGVLSFVLNEQIPSGGGIIVNAMHVKTIDGLTDIVIGSAKAGISASTGSTLPVPPLPPLPSLF